MIERCAAGFVLIRNGRCKECGATPHESCRRQDQRDRIDAERYRWLRQQHWDEAVIGCVVNPKVAVKLGHDCPSLERLDALIDAQIRKAPEGALDAT